MHYYMTRKGGSMIFRLTAEDDTRVKKHILAGQSIPDDCLAFLGEKKVAGHIAAGTFVAVEEGAVPSDADLGEADVNPITVGVGDEDFMPEATAQPGKQRDEALQNLLDEQERRKAETTIDEEVGGTPDGAIKVTRPVDDDDDDGEYADLMTDVERDAVAAIESGNQHSIFDEDEDEDED